MGRGTPPGQKFQLLYPVRLCILDRILQWLVVSYQGGSDRLLLSASFLVENETYLLGPSPPLLTLVLLSHQEKREGGASAFPCHVQVQARLASVQIGENESGQL